MNKQILKLEYLAIVLLFSTLNNTTEAQNTQNESFLLHLPRNRMDIVLRCIPIRDSVLNLIGYKAHLIDSLTRISMKTDTVKTELHELLGLIGGIQTIYQQRKVDSLYGISIKEAKFDSLLITATNILNLKSAIDTTNSTAFYQIVLLRNTLLSTNYFRSKKIYTEFLNACKESNLFDNNKWEGYNTYNYNYICHQSIIYNNNTLYLFPFIIPSFSPIFTMPFAMQVLAEQRYSILYK